MNTRTKVSEKEIAAAVRVYLESQGLTVRAEVPVTLPDHGQVFADLVGMKANETGEVWTICECKRRLDASLEDQVKRWMPFAQYVIAAHGAPKVATRQYDMRAKRIVWSGVGRLIVHPDGPMRAPESPAFHEADTRLLSAAFHSHSGEHDPAAGSAAAKRMTPERCRWERARKWLEQHPGVGFKWVNVRRDIPELRMVTSAQARRAIFRGEFVGVHHWVSNGMSYFASEAP